MADPLDKMRSGLSLDQIDTLDRWARRRLGKGVEGLTVSDLREGLAPLGGLSYLERSSGRPLGGRVAPHLRHVEEREAMHLLRRAEQLLNEPDARRGPVGRPRLRRRGPIRVRRKPRALT